ncbi:tyrosinase central domain containing protein [Nitzschia inconspicua]|uniref:Tyrosinase central domain containing protein n=1 Tax=Nitzschia inconspicua TaxID=303405 RepID=A0A9K3KBA8_9STRA|nr:tyrosinase central domain containing protein [Nitzschia inconspicua]KAG7362548.1 tyrosinase central domain containing protein [Nitzschia inconspicua]
MMKKTKTKKSVFLSLLFSCFSFCCTNEVSAQQQQQQQQQERCPTTRERKPWKDLTCAEQNEFFASIRRLKDNGIYDEFARVHIQNAAPSHGTPEFLPWHRWFIYQFESALRRVSADPCITLPYWDWESDAGRESRASIMAGNAFGSFAGVDTRTRRCRWTTVDGSCLQRDMDPSFRFWSQSRLVALMTQYRQYADDFPNNPNRNNGFRAAFESGPHAVPHNMIGGNMIDPTSANDPIFFLHHSNVDRLWAMWQDYRGQSTRTTFSAPEHYEGRRLNSPMPFHGNNNIWNFRLSNGSFPSPQQVMSNSGDALRVRYIQDRMIPNHLPNRQWFSSRPRFSTGCNQRQGRTLFLGEDDDDDNEELQRNITSAGIQTISTTNDGSSSSKQQQHQQSQTGRHQWLPNFRGRKGNRLDSSKPPSSNNQFVTDPMDGLIDTTTPASYCLGLNTFQSTVDRERWNTLCKSFMSQLETDNHSTSLLLSPTFVTEMVTNLTSIMALEECQFMGNPINAKEAWMNHMQLSNERVAIMDCFHIPDRI